MTREFDMAHSLAVGVEDRGGAWEFVRGFAENWSAALSDGDGWAEADLAAAEERLGIRLPLALREAYLLFGRRQDITSNHDVLLGPSQLHVDEAEEALVFRHENQGAASWGILLDELSAEDPAVFVRADLADKSAECWERWLERLSLCFVEIVLSESLQADDGLCDFLGDFDHHGVEVLEQNCARLPLPECSTAEQEGAVRWFLGRDVLLRDDDGACLLARGRTQSALDGIRELIPGDWMNDFR
ncbi:SMI1/KNR4 family protein [Streptomyces sp. NPDC058382]|uniref:SMI1/KNR4 family protein n=1 Tax=unclassified Streptomyces TaxID=2593676 RepID=UPI00364182EC